MSWNSVHKKIVFRGQGGNGPEGKVEGGVVWLDGTAYIVQQSDRAGIMLFAVKPGSLEMREVQP